MGSLCMHYGVHCRSFHWFLGKCFFWWKCIPTCLVFALFVYVRSGAPDGTRSRAHPSNVIPDAALFVFEVNLVHVVAQS